MARYPEAMTRMNRVFTNPVMTPLARRVPPWAIVHHVGRKSGKAYNAPVVAFPTPDGFLIPMAYGNDRDWVKNVMQAGQFELERKGRFLTVTDPTLRPGSEVDDVKPSLARTLRGLKLEGVLALHLAG